MVTVRRIFLDFTPQPVTA